ncbi:MAG: cell cycle transcriptional regulator TrcR [Alphaproteobacteria bacterium]
MSSALKKNSAPKLLMPKATAVWLIENTGLTFSQIAQFTDLTDIEVEALANEEIGRGLVGRNPVEHKELTQEELARCENDPNAELKVAKNDLPTVKMRSKGPKYTPVSKRGDKPDAIAYILKHNPEISDAQITKLVGTTKPTINNVRERTHPNMSNIKPRHPADLGLCSYTEFEAAVEKGLRAQGKDPEAVKAQRQAEAQDALKQEEPAETHGGGGFDFSNFLGDTSYSNKDDD